ncbi:TetR/AcrR family transcriptional regulator [uncultured Draconibacterium sp.]|uniref:TetR/AcrR family transcriptional regulator n=1 Tax=uncultured Draconibacterium sp. TaxID=1573823 RepID=UPI002AA9302D|nr:TetR/AcrR family transcriptional regulator [uncultured Draconibacterium sp.]
MKKKWLNEGYKQFAKYGPDKLSINNISRAVGLSRASFYHYFGEVNIFIDELLEMHWNISEEFKETGKKRCKNLIPDLYNLLAEYPIPLQFGLQLFHHRHQPQLNLLFIKSYEAISQAFALELFAKSLKLNACDVTVSDLWITVGEAWYSRIDPEDLSSITLQRHAKEILHTVNRIVNSKLYESFNATF